ncbi:MAG TPA: calcium:proton antiporter [Ignavibacteria bacterium]|nr:calcium:proton antiporter [Ignavibacteria bacterium]
MAKFLKREKSFLIALLTLIIITVFQRDLFEDVSLGASLVLFFVIFVVIIYAAIGVADHAEVLAHKFGEPYGTMILTFSAITVEIIMVTAMMLHEAKDPTLARDTIYATLMILINGITGLCMVIGGFKYGEQFFNLKSSNSFLSMIIAIIGIGLFLPAFANPEQLTILERFLIFASLALYAFFLSMQSKKHSYFFSYKNAEIKSEREEELESKKINGWYHAGMLLAIILVIAMIAEFLSISIENGILMLGLPVKLAALIIALIIIAPEGLTALRAAYSDDMQRVINITFGSTLSTITLTIPAVLIVSFITGNSIILGLSPFMGVMVITTLLLGFISTTRGDSNALQGFIHIILFITFVFLIFLG